MSDGLSHLSNALRLLLVLFSLAACNLARPTLPTPYTRGNAGDPSGTDPVPTPQSTGD